MILTTQFKHINSHASPSLLHPSNDKHTISLSDSIWEIRQ